MLKATPGMNGETTIEMEIEEVEEEQDDYAVCNQFITWIK